MTSPASEPLALHVQWIVAVIAAVVSGSFVALASQPRPRLQMAAGAMTVDDAVRLWRANKHSHHWHERQLIPAFVRLTNLGNGAAFDIELTGTNCVPRVWAGDTAAGAAFLSNPDDEPSIGLPMWSQALARLGAGESVTVFVMRPAPDNGALPEDLKLTATWPRLPKWGIWRKQLHVQVFGDPQVETGWPGAGELWTFSDDDPYSAGNKSSRVKGPSNGRMDLPDVPPA